LCVGLFWDFVFVDFVFVLYFVNNFVLMVIAVTPFRSYFVWFEFRCAWYLVIGVSFCFVYDITFVLLCVPSGLFCCVLWVVVHFMICGVVLFSFGVGWPCVLFDRCFGVALSCTLFGGVKLAYQEFSGS